MMKPSPACGFIRLVRDLYDWIFGAGKLVAAVGKVRTLVFLSSAFWFTRTSNVLESRQHSLRAYGL